jgi:hypothetical protein
VDVGTVQHVSASDMVVKSLRGLWSVVVLAAVVTACGGSHRDAQPRTSSAPVSAALALIQAPLPAGWARFSYGSLSVAAPKTWKVSRVPLANCAAPSPNSVSEYTVTRVTASSCPAESGDVPTVAAIAIECLRGAANGLYSGSATTTVVRGATLSRIDTRVWLQSGSWEGVVFLAENFGPASLGRAILATVEPTGRPC